MPASWFAPFVRWLFVALFVVFLPPSVPGMATAACAGDCDGDGEVTIEEILLGVGMVLGAPLDACPSFDTNLDGMVTVEEVVVAIRHALDACPLEIATPVLHATSPANGATSVLRTAWLRLDFDGSVDPGSLAGFRLRCGGTVRPVTAHLLPPSTVIMNPVGDLPSAAPCEVTWLGSDGIETLAFTTASSGAPATIVYDRTVPSMVPYPDDIWTTPDATTRSGIRLNLPTDIVGLLRIFLREGNRLDGFSPVGYFVIETSDQVDPASLPRTAAESLDPLATIGLFDLDQQSPTFARRVPFRLDVRTDTNVAGVTSHSILIFPSIPLTPGGRYGLVVTRRARVSAQRPLDPSEFFRAAIAAPMNGEAPQTGQVRALAGEVLDVVGQHVSPPIEPDDVALALRISVRTTDDIPADLMAIKAQLLAADRPAFAIDRVEPGAPYGADVAAIVTGHWEVPDWRDGNGLYFRRDVTGAPVSTRTQTVPFVLALPRAALDGPVPIIMYQHGNPGSAQAEVPNHAGRSLAAAGFAVMGFTDNLNREVSRGIGSQADQITAQVTAVFFALVNNRRVPDYWAQTNGEQLAFVRMIQGIGSLDVLPIGAPDGVPDLDPTLPLGYVGISQGANHAPALLPYAPEIHAAALVVGGNRLAETLLHQAAETFLTTLGPIDQTLTAPGIWVGLALFQALYDQQETHNHARFIYRDPLEIAGTTRKASILLVEGLEDSLVPNNATDSLAWLLGPLPHLKPVQRPVPFLEPTDGPLMANIDPETTAAFFQYVPIGVPGIDPTPGCLELSPVSANEGHYCAQGARESLHQRVPRCTSRP
jgi:hypothetical protein